MNIAKEAMMDMYLRMVRIREFENKAQSLFAEGKIPGFVHLYLGEEAVATGVCECLRDDDYITSTHRGHGHIIAKGGDLKYMMAELFGKATGYCKGKGGSMHRRRLHGLQSPPALRRRDGKAAQVLLLRYRSGFLNILRNTKACGKMQAARRFARAPRKIKLLQMSHRRVPA